MVFTYFCTYRFRVYRESVFYLLASDCDLARSNHPFSTNMRKIIWAAILCSLITSGSIRAQTAFFGVNYRIGEGSETGFSADDEHAISKAFLLGGQWSFLTIGPQIGAALVLLSQGKWAQIGPEIGPVWTGGTAGSFSSNVSFNYGVVVKLAFVAIPQSAFLSIDYAAQTKLGVGLTWPLN